MKKALLIFVLLRCITVAAQIRISDFKQSLSDGVAVDVRTSVADPEGQPCAVLKLETRQSGWTFDAGLAGIMETRYADGLIWIYVPSSARKLTIAHREYGILRDWCFPVSLEPGRTYTMKLSYELSRQTSKAQHPGRVVTQTNPTRVSTPSPHHAMLQVPAPTLDKSAQYASMCSERAFCNHFVDFYVGFNCSRYYDDYYEYDDAWFGFSYTWIGNRVGPYMSLAINADECFSVLGGVAFRLTDPRTATLDWHLYGGAGLIDEGLGFDIGTRFAWRSAHKLSHWDFGLGCQFSQESIIPTVSVGLYIWGIPTVVCLGIALGGV